jgi:hypothetical protein
MRTCKYLYACLHLQSYDPASGCGAEGANARLIIGYEETHIYYKRLHDSICLVLISCSKVSWVKLA